MESKYEQAFGHFAAPLWCQFLIKICQFIPTGSWLGKRLAFLIRKPVLLRNQSPIDTLSHGVKFRLFPKQNLSDKRLLCTPDLLDGIERDYFAKTLIQNACILDVGANIGGYGLLLAASRPDIKVFCVEADPALAQRLNQHIAFNSFENRCHCLELAVSPNIGTVKLYLDDINQGRNSLVKAFVTNDQNSHPPSLSISVPSRPLEEIMKEQEISHIDLLKMDIEGYEFPVLEHFFKSAEPLNWPSFIQLEQHRNMDDNEAILLAMKNGYQKIFQTRMNVILKRQ